MVKRKDNQAAKLQEPASKRQNTGQTNLADISHLETSISSGPVSSDLAQHSVAISANSQPTLPSGMSPDVMDIETSDLQSSEASDFEVKSFKPSKKRKRQPNQRSKSKSKATASSTEDNDEEDEHFHFEGDHAPIHDIGEIFEDMAIKAYNHLGLEQVIRNVGRQLRVATMCSGTESPILAVQLVNDALEKSFDISIIFEHVFSAEIDSNKQAYIERNFHPPILFRDILEVATEVSASTAYGGKVEVPSGVDLLIARVNKKNFSGLNNWRKELSDSGESGDTFRAILEYAKRCRPTLIILENICHAPWDKIKAAWENDAEQIKKGKAQSKSKKENEGNHDEPKDKLESFWGPEERGYAAEYLKVDTKNYYLPHTRNRVYMVCVDKAKYKDASALAAKWVEKMVAFRRPATSSVEAFLLPDDDSRVQRARQDLAMASATDKKAGKTSGWAVCQGRYQEYRSKHDLGVDRPLLQWLEGGSCNPPDYWWPEFVRNQVDRVLDTLEIGYLRNAAKGYDSEYKLRVWELSQNIDRFTDSTPFGVTPCITPSGSMFLTSRGGPLTGLETLALQGLPIDSLLLTRENQRQLHGLAGNAMTSTVVGAAILSALIVGYSAFEGNGEGFQKTPHQISREVFDLGNASDNEVRTLDFSPPHIKTTSELCKMAKESARLCVCEGQTNTTSRPLYQCKACEHTACRKCRGVPAHDYVPMKIDYSRTSPTLFALALKEALPMRVKIGGSNELMGKIKCLNRNTGLSNEEFDKYLKALGTACSTEHRYHSVHRSHEWTATYESPYSKLKLVLSQGKAVWYLYAKPDRQEPVRSMIRHLLDRPVVRISVDSDDILHGAWEYCIPVWSSANLTIRGKGELIASWESQLGLQSPELIDKKVWSHLEIKAKNDLEDDSILDFDVGGIYQLLPDCGTACASLHKRILGPGFVAQNPPLFFFLDPERIGDPADDQFVFSEDNRRLAFGDIRQVVGRLESSWRQSHDLLKDVKCERLGRWERCYAELQPYSPTLELDAATYTFPSEVIPAPALDSSTTNGADQMPKALDCHSAVSTVLSCKVPLESSEDVGWKEGPWALVSQTKQKQTFANFAWLLERIKTLEGFKNDWKGIDLPSAFQQCQTCSPQEPEMKWKRNVTGKGPSITPYEDVKQSSTFECAYKTRPTVFQTYTKIDGGHTNQESGVTFMGRIEVTMNALTLGHRALAKLKARFGTHDVSLEWRLDTKHDATAKESLPAFTLKNNKGDQEATHIFTIPTNNGMAASAIQLRKEQQRSLKWMLSQESQDAPAFREQEIEEEVHSSLGWRAEARARQNKTVRGGVLADEVGYGKTAISLALIDAQHSAAATSAQTCRRGLISIKATLILVPKTLMSQWKEEIDKFLGKKYKVLVINSIFDLNKLTIAELESEDIILACWGLSNSKAYMEILAMFSGLPDCHVSCGHESWLECAYPRISAHVEELKTTPLGTFTTSLQKKLADTLEDSEFIERVPHDGKGRLKGAKYAAQAKAETTVDKAVNTKPSLRSASEYGKKFNPNGSVEMSDMRCPLLQIFHFNRIIIDEFIYIKEKDYSFAKSLHANYRWILSGTPALDDFADVKRIASFLGINLGVDDDALEILMPHNIKAIRKNRTRVEEFRALTGVRTHAWHLQRQSHAQEFLDQFVRQNPPEIDDIKCDVRICAVSFPPAERAIFMELQQQLSTHDFNVCRGGRGKADEDRVKRLKEMLETSQSPVEALLKRASYFQLEGIVSKTYVTGLDACNHILEIRDRQLKALEQELQRHLQHAAWLNMQCARGSAEYEPEQYNTWKRTIKSHVQGDYQATKLVLEMIQKAEEDYNPSHESLYYREPLTAEEQEQLKEFLEKLKERQKAAKARKKKTQKTRGVNATSKKKGVKEASQIRPVEAESEEDHSGDDASQDDDDAPKDDDDAPKDDDEALEEVAAKNPLVQKSKLPEKIPQSDFARFGRTLRDLTNLLRNLTDELVARHRSQRFIKSFIALFQWQISSKAAPVCACTECETTELDPSEAYVLGLCGHILCGTCLRGLTKSPVCAVRYCNASAQKQHTTRATALLGDNDTAPIYGAKLDCIIELIKGTAEDDQVLLFVQFDDLMEKVADALVANDISNHCITHKHKNPDKMMEDFRKNKDKDRKKVLLLNPSNETAAGANLTNASHIIFISPLLTNSLQKYKASLTQCIGRARRYGQTKDVQVYRFLALNTTDVDILQEREGKKLMKKEDGTWCLLPDEVLSDKEKEIEWGTGFGDRRRGDRGLLDWED